MQQFDLHVEGIDGEYEATLSFGDTFVAGFTSKSLKDAQRRARSEAQAFLNENRPTRREHYDESFSL